MTPASLDATATWVSGGRIELDYANRFVVIP
jgi:hypothetical protein